MLFQTCVTFFILRNINNDILRKILVFTYLFFVHTMEVDKTFDYQHFF